jgi:hypothetical protein
MKTSKNRVRTAALALVGTSMLMVSSNSYAQTYGYQAYCNELLAGLNSFYNTCQGWLNEGPGGPDAINYQIYCNQAFYQSQLNDLVIAGCDL